jgi:5-methylcytosine-specific restriction endonuclease McrA
MIIVQLSFIEGKICTLCGQWKLRADFHNDRKRKDGLNPHCKVCRSAYHAQCADRDNALHREWYHRNNDYHLSYVADYRIRKADEIRAQYQRWARANPDIVKLKRKRRYARKKGAEGQYTLKEWTELCACYDYRCLCCGNQCLLTADHIVPLTKGGSDYITNIQPLCASCNSRKGDKVIDYRDAWDDDTTNE